MVNKQSDSKFLQPLLAIFSTTIWISLSEFSRNQLIFKSFWTDHYASLGLVFPERPINGAMWGVWSLTFAVVIYFLVKQFPIRQAAAISWLSGFVLMWIAIGNLRVLPVGLLLPAIPLSIIEAYVAAVIAKKLQ